MENCKYCCRYMERARREVENFDEACRILHMNPKSELEWPNIVKAFTMIGQFGTIRLARAFPEVTDEAQFHLVAQTALHFYWMILEEWDAILAETAAEREAKASR